LTEDSNPLISITVCVRDGVQWVDGCMEALQNQTYRPLEIIAVDDGSVDGSTEKLLKWNNPANEISTYVLTQDAKGLSSARQLALEKSNGEWVAITDIDVRPTQNWISNLFSETVPVDSEEDIVAVTGRTIFQKAEDLVSQLRSVEIEAKYRSRSRLTSLANGPCSMFRKKSLMAIGGFNPDWYHAEDMEVSLKLLGNGGNIVYAPEAVVAHVPESGRRRFLAKRSRDARAHVRIMRKYPKRRRKGPDLDFIGSSTMVLAVVPLWISAIISGFPFLYFYFTSEDNSWDSVQTWWQTNVLLITIALLLIQELIIWRGPLGVVNRGAIVNSGRNRIVVYFALKGLIIQWSLSLWKGLFLGFYDMITKKNGHDFKKKL